MKYRKELIYNKKWEKDNYQSISVLVLMGIHNLLTTMEAKPCITIIILHHIIITRQVPTHFQVIILTHLHIVIFQLLLAIIVLQLQPLPSI